MKTIPNWAAVEMKRGMLTPWSDRGEILKAAEKYRKAGMEKEAKRLEGWAKVRGLAAGA